MNCDNTSDLDYQKTEEETLTCEVSDDALEAASGTPGRAVPTLFHNTYSRAKRFDNALRQALPRTKALHGMLCTTRIPACIIIRVMKAPLRRGRRPRRPLNKRRPRPKSGPPVCAGHLALDA